MCLATVAFGGIVGCSPDSQEEDEDDDVVVGLEAPYGFVDDWLVLGPFANPLRRHARIDNDFLCDGVIHEGNIVPAAGGLDLGSPDSGGCADADSVYLGATEPCAGGACPVVAAISNREDPGTTLDLLEALGAGDRMAYAWVYVNNLTGAPLDVYVGAASSDLLQVEVNRQEVLRQVIVYPAWERRAGNDRELQTRALATLEPGYNLVQAKVFRDEGDWALRMGFFDASSDFAEFCSGAAALLDGDGVIEITTALPDGVALPGTTSTLPTPVAAEWMGRFAQAVPDEHLGDTAYFQDLVDAIEGAGGTILGTLPQIGATQFQTADIDQINEALADLDAALGEPAHDEAIAFRDEGHPPPPWDGLQPVCRGDELPPPDCEGGTACTPVYEDLPCVPPAAYLRNIERLTGSSYDPALDSWSGGALAMHEGTDDVVVAVLEGGGADVLHPAIVDSFDLSGFAGRNFRDLNGDGVVDDSPTCTRYAFTRPGSALAVLPESSNITNNNATFLGGDGHGTWVSGLVSASPASRYGNVNGVAPGVQVRVYRRSNGVFENAHAVISAADDGADVINMSFGLPDNGFDSATAHTIWIRAMDYASERAIVTKAVGNNGLDLTDAEYPEELPDHPMVVASGTNLDWGDTPEELVSFSAYGEGAVDLAAPSGETAFTEGGDFIVTEWVFTPYPLNREFFDECTWTDGCGWDFASGTSYSAASVAAVAALIISYTYQLTETRPSNDEVLEILTETADASNLDLGTCPCGTVSCCFGAGVADAHAALLEVERRYGDGD